MWTGLLNRAYFSQLHVFLRNFYQNLWPMLQKCTPEAFYRSQLFFSFATAWEEGCDGRGRRAPIAVSLCILVFTKSSWKTSVIIQLCWQHKACWKICLCKFFFVIRIYELFDIGSNLLSQGYHRSIINLSEKSFKSARVFSLTLFMNTCPGLLATFWQKVVWNNLFARAWSKILLYFTNFTSKNDKNWNEILPWFWLGLKAVQ